MKTTTKVIFASALMLAAAAPTLSHAAYFVDQTKTWAVTTQTSVMGKRLQVDRALDAMAYVPADNNFGNEYFQKGGIINQH
ncbi:MAG TPA: hypothetical protein VFL53_11055 [Pseudolabrys sp.]|nr:hypothetical protein [Pseudolabrys sp.]